MKGVNRFGTTIISILVAALLLTASSRREVGVTLTVFNQTGYDLDSLELDSSFYSIRKGDSIVVTQLRELFIMGDTPFGNANAVIKNRIKARRFPGCGTGIIRVTSGSYKGDITLWEDEDGYELQWSYHEEKK